MHVLPKKWEKEVLQLEEKKQRQSPYKFHASKLDNESKLETLETDKPGTSADTSRMSLGTRINTTIISTVKEYCKYYIKKIENWYRSEDLHHIEMRFTKIFDIMLFKHIQEYCD